LYSYYRYSCYAGVQKENFESRLNSILDTIEHLTDSAPVMTSLVTGDEAGTQSDVVVHAVPLYDVQFSELLVSGVQ